jgi:hypothetical protein
MSVIFATFIVASVIFYLNETEALVVYLEKISSVSSWAPWRRVFDGVLLVKAYRVSETGESYLEFLNSTYNNFATNLVSCAICLGFWLSVFAAIFIGEPFSCGIIAVGSLFLFYVLKILTKLSYKL